MEQRQISTVNDDKDIEITCLLDSESGVSGPTFTFLLFNICSSLFACMEVCEREGGRRGSQPLEVSTWSGCKGREGRNSQPGELVHQGMVLGLCTGSDLLMTHSMR